ncbi:MAG: iron-containing alcohol dehydrogenase [Candidatus Omnitrophota bacterium]
MSDFYWYLPSEVFFGSEAINNLKTKASAFGKKALLVTGKRFAEKSGLRDRIASLLTEAKVDVVTFSEAREDPTTETVAAGAEVCSRENCGFVIGAGGGSALDTAKGIAILTTNPGGVGDYFGTDKVLCAPLPIIAIPTTAGSGSEVTRYAVIIDPKAKTKKTVSSAGIIPRLALIQPSLTLSLSGFLTASTGLDALSHAVEGALTKKITTLTLAIAKEAVQIITKILPLAVNTLNDMECREKMSLAAMMAGMVINQTGTIIGHGMGYPLTINYRVQHGAAGSLVLPAIFDFLREKGYGERIEEVTGWDEPASAWRNFCRRVGLPISLKEVGVKETELSQFAKEALVGCQRSMENLGVTLTESDFHEIYRMSF